MTVLSARRRFRLALWFLPLLIVPLLASDARASFPGTNGKVAVVRDGGIWSMNVYGSISTDQTQLTDDGGNPAWSADGTKIAFNRAGSIYTMDADGNAVTLVTTGGNPAWSPDGAKLAFVRTVGTSQIFTANVDGTGVSQITNSSGTNSSPDWSPNGQKIAFHSTRDGDSDIYTMNTDGTGAVNLTNASGSEGDLVPTWSPNGQRIGFIWCQSVICPPGYIFRVDADGTNLVQIAPTPGNYIFTGRTPTWSPDGTTIIYDDSQWGLIWAYNANGGTTPDGETPVNNTVGDSTPAWQPVVSSYARPIAATPIRDALVPAQVECAASNATATHEAPFAQPACPNPQQASGYLTVGSPDYNQVPAKMSGYHKMTVLAGDPGNPAEEADIRLEASVSDVRNKSNLSDYGGELQVVANLRITDRRNGGFGAGTVTDFPLKYAIQCQTTADTTVGSTCSIDTTADALFPGAVKEGKRSIWEVHGIQVMDGGSDGVASTQNNTLFAVEGVFVP